MHNCDEQDPCRECGRCDECGHDEECYEAALDSRIGQGDYLWDAERDGDL
jgi:hypothetical protein